MTRKSVIKHLIAGLVLALFALALAEGGLRVFGRGGEPACRTVFGPAPGGPRPAVVLLAGDCLADDNTASSPEGPAAELQRILSSANPQTPVTVINGAACGQSSRQTLSGLPSLLGRVAPDVVVILSGKSDRWNISGPGSNCLDFICSTSTLAAPYCPLTPSGWLANTGLAKFYRGAWLGLHKKYLFWQAGAADTDRLVSAYSGGGLDEEMVLSYADAMLRQRRTDKVYSLSLGMIGAVGPSSRYYTGDLSFYRLFARAAREMGTESSAAGDLRRLLQARPELEKNEAFAKYLSSLENASRFNSVADENTRAALAEMAALSRKSGAVVLLQNYPDGSAVNALIGAAARQASAPLVDHAAAFARFTGRGGGSRLLEDNGLCRKAGCRFGAENIADVVDGLLSRDRAVLLE